ncbi:hypothetical protein H2198_003836 [Neophaeococcomyces mojaviensis]|uniref:Uncharacterized protein n=1 Tax=Neophaeococcomyces mojaviensis TaxID=3383035 RepID=A0ACC3AAA9_9EURO|nr:hypothetical protein H2198_003836 [Knufia sp. JES_112]
MWSLFVALRLVLAFIVASYAQDQVDDSLLTFKSRPDLYPPKLSVNISENGVTPGYIFMAPYQSLQNTAAIYDIDGTLVWYGYGVTGTGGNIHDFRVCSYNGTDHLCFFNGEQYSGYSRGQAVIMDTHLRQVRTVTSQNGLSAIDQHEFNIINDTAITVIYHPERYDLSAFNVTAGEGWIQNSIFQDTNLTTGELVFEWSAVEHVAISEGYVSPNQSEVAGTGFDARSPWDYFHINSVDKNGDGDYLVSARHVSALYKISGEDGHVIWRCGGKFSDFELLDGLNWSYQHDARWLSQNASTDIISFFDNASNGFNQSASHSAGYIIKLDHTADPPTVSLLQSYPAPEDIPISASQGNIQILKPGNWANSNTFIGWGSQPYVTEHDSRGNVVYRANIAANGKMNYRAFKFNITLSPMDSPALYTYALDANANTVYYMSWNGATEVRSWRVYGRSGCTDQWRLINEVPKSDFETTYTVLGYQEFGMVEAVAENGTGIRNSTNRGIKAFVPSSSLTNNCTVNGCNVVSGYGINTGQEVVAAETRSGCAALPVSTTPNSTTGSQTANKAIDLQPGIWSTASIVVFSSLLVSAIL